MGLREQLLKAGLASKKQAKQAAAEARKLGYDQHRGKESAGEKQAEQQAERERIAAEQESKREADHVRNLALEEHRKQREVFFRCRQLLKSNRLNEPRAQLAYHFLEPCERAGEPVVFVRRIFVTESQREMLGRGKFALARPDPEREEYALVPSHTADAIAALAPVFLVLRHPPLDDAEELNVD